ncbi:MAG: phosphotransferase family protein, partial [Gammaproteobacteria bacterium AqS3]|nr:phosphotransferase family protein [Gammaproteobacteria bacterium AqS3]
DGAEWPVICRINQDSALIDTEARNEFRAYQAFEHTAVPTPAPVFEEADPAVLGAPFIVMQQVEGAPASPFHSNPYGEHREAIGEAFWTHLGQIAAHPVESFADEEWPKRPASSWRDALEYWEGVLESDDLGPQPVLSAARRFLHRSPPPEAGRLSLVHGDYRTGNLLVDGGRITAVLDWEMAHLGDPLEDLAWALSAPWHLRCPDWPAGTVERERALELWQQASGLTIDPAALHWWEVFACVKGIGIWTSAGFEFLQQTNLDPINLFSSWGMTALHERAIIDLLRGGRSRAA